MPSKMKVKKCTKENGKPQNQTKLKTKARKLREKKLQRSSQRYLTQVTALKENNRSLAAALDEVRHEYRHLQNENLELQEERQLLLERVAGFEHKLSEEDQQISVVPAIMFLNEAHLKIQQAKESLGGIPGVQLQLFPAAQNAPNLSPIRDTSGGRVHFELTDDVPATSHQPRFASTPVLSDNSQTVSMILSPGAILFTESKTDTGCEQEKTKSGSSKQAGSPTEANQPQSSENSPGLPESGGGEKFQVGNTLDQLEITNPCGTQRPKRKCASSLSLSYQEPSLCKKLRRGDPFTEWTTDWSPKLKNKNRPKKKAKATTGNRRRILQDLTNMKQQK